MNKTGITVICTLIVAATILLGSIIFQSNRELHELKSYDIGLLKIENKSLKTLLKSQYLLETTSSVTLTFYHPPSGGINSYGDPTKTATGNRPIPGWTIAISSSLVHKGWLGKEVYIDGFGMFKALDRMNTSLTGDRIDICVGALKDIPKQGRYTDVVASVIR